MSRYHRYRRAHGRSRRDAFYDRERRLRARIKHLVGQLQDWLDEPEDDVVWEDLGVEEPSNRSRWTGRGRLYRDRDRGRIGGVCAGLSQYYRLRLWKVRAIALVALFLAPSITFPIYILALLLLPDAPAYRKPSYQKRQEYTRGSASRGDRQAAEEAIYERVDREPARQRASVARTKAKFKDLETRLRLMEAYVTSRRFETDRAFRDLEST